MCCEWVWAVMASFQSHDIKLHVQVLVRPIFDRVQGAQASAAMLHQCAFSTDCFPWLSSLSVNVRPWAMPAICWPGGVGLWAAAWACLYPWWLCDGVQCLACQCVQRVPLCWRLLGSWRLGPYLLRLCSHWRICCLGLTIFEATARTVLVTFRLSPPSLMETQWEKVDGKTCQNDRLNVAKDMASYGRPSCRKAP